MRRRSEPKSPKNPPVLAPVGLSNLEKIEELLTECNYEELLRVISLARTVALRKLSTASTSTEEYGIAFPEWEQMRARAFAETNNGVYALQLIHEAHRQGLPLHKIAWQWIAGCAGRWLDAEGKDAEGKHLSMDRVMELKAEKEGTNPPYKALLLEHRDELLLIDMARLHVLGATIDEAAHMVARRLQAMPEKEWNLSKWEDLNKIGSKSLRDKFFQWPERLETENKLREMVSGWTSASMREYLQKFPADCIPKKWKMYLK